MEMEKTTVAELLTLKYLTESVRPFPTIYKHFSKNLNATVLHGAPVALKTLADELVIRFLLIFVRVHGPIWMRFQDEPLNNFFSREEWATICERWGRDNDAISILVLDRWLSRSFRRSLEKEEVAALVEDFKKALNDALELITSAKLFLQAICEALKIKAVSADEILRFLDSNKDDKAPAAYDRCINFLRYLPDDVQKSIGDALVIERNYLSSHGLFPYLQRMEDGILRNYFLKILQTHARKLARTLGEETEDHIGPLYEVYYKILSKFKRQPEVHFEHYLNRWLHRERKHSLTHREKMILRDDLNCPFCDLDLKPSIKASTRLSQSVVCPNCKTAIGLWAFENDLIPNSELADSFFRDPFDSKGPTYWVRTFTTPSTDPNYSELLNLMVESNVSLTEKERRIIEAVREADGEGIPMSETLRRIARELGESYGTLREHYKRGLKKLKKN